MKENSQLPMHPVLVVCPKPDCGASGRIGVHSRAKRQYICHACGKTFAETTGTMLYGLKRPIWMVLLVLALLSHGCPVQAIVFAFGLDERTVADWHRKAGEHAKQVHHEQIAQASLELGQVQADELYSKTQLGSVWIASALSVFSRLWLGGVISHHRDEALISSLITQVRQAAAWGCSLLWAVDGFSAYRKAILKVFRDPLYTGKIGRPPMVVWNDLHIVQVLKQDAARQRATITRRVLYGSLKRAESLMQESQVLLGCINTAYIERLNATLRTWMPYLVRRTRTPSGSCQRLEQALFWTACVYNFCHRHATLDGSPAMAAGLTDHIWSIEELIRYRCRRE